MSEERKEKEKQYETEWSFSFSNLGESISSALSSLGVGEDAEIKTTHFEELLENAESAHVILEPTIGKATVTPLSDSDNLFEADLAYVGEVKFVVEDDETHKTVRLGQNVRKDVLQPIKDAIGSFSRREELKWDMRLTPNIPLDLQINSGVTANDFDLSGLQITRLRINGGTGKTDLNLPTMGGEYPVDINSGTGELNVDVPAGAHIKLDAKNGTGATNIVIGSGATVKAHLSGGIGQCSVTVPADAGVRVKATTGLGKVNMPQSFIAVKVEEFVATVGTWETPNYANAENKIDIQYEGGIGSFNIRLG
jgi:hypothetical protein